MQCPKCQFDNPMDPKYCSECGGKLEIVCVRCNKSNPPGSKFCNACGHNLIRLRGPAALDYAKPQTYMRIPIDSGRRFRMKPATHSD